MVGWFKIQFKIDPHSVPNESHIIESFNNNVIQFQKICRSFYP